MKTRITSLLLLAFVLAGCGDKKSESTAANRPAPQKPPTQQADPGTPAPDAPGAPPQAVAATSESAGTVEAQVAATYKDDPNIMSKADALNLVINDYITSYGKPPSSLDELVQKRMISRLPEPPAGKKFVYDAAAKRVKLENK